MATCEDTDTEESHHVMTRAEHTAASQRIPRIDSHLPTAGGGKEGFPYWFQRERGPANTVISVFYLPVIYFFCFKPPNLLYLLW